MTENNKVKLTGSSLRAYVMIVVLAAIWIYFHFATNNLTPEITDFGNYVGSFFTGIAAAIGNIFTGAQTPNWVTDGIFLTPRNLSNLMQQMSVTAIIAIGMLMVIVSGNIDLSVGSLLGLTGGVAAYCLSSLEYSLPTSLLIAVVVGVLIGAFQGLLAAYLNIPSFIVTLGGLLALRGVVKWLLGGNTIGVSNETFGQIGNGNLSLMLGWLLAAAAVAFVLFSAYRRAKAVKDYGLGEPNYKKEILKTIIPIIAIVGFMAVMNSYQGMPYSVLILLAIALLGAFLTRATTFGRYLYAIGGNADAARLSGINIKFSSLKVFAILGGLTAIASLIYTSRVGSASPDAGVLKELDAIAACVIGGASLMGGRGTIFGACLGALIMATLDNGMSLLNVRDFLQDIVKGSILVAAVGLDMLGRKDT